MEAEELLVRIAEIEVYPEWLDAYLDSARTVGAESVAKENGVVCIFPMQAVEDPRIIRIVEIYRGRGRLPVASCHASLPHVQGGDAAHDKVPASGHDVPA